MDEFYDTVSPALISRFKEREENVKADIFHAYVALLKQTKTALIPQFAAAAAINDNNATEMMDLGEDGPANKLLGQVPNLVKAVHKLMKEKSVKTRQGCFLILTELISVIPGALADHIPALIPGIQFSLGDKQSSSNMKIDTLAFILHLLQNQGQMPSVFHPHAPVLVPAIIAAVSDPFYKISSEALLVLESLVKVLRPLGIHTNFDFKPYTSKVYQCCFVRLKASDIDQEVKERAIGCMGQILAHLGDHLKAEMPACLPIFLDRLKNEITRLTAVKALINIAKSELKIELKPILAESLPILAGFLRKNQRTLKLSSLVLLDTLVKNYSAQITDKNLEPVLVELQPLLNDSDLHIAQLTMNLLTSVAKLHKGSLITVQKTSLNQIFCLSQSPLLQGAALNAMLEFFQSLVAARLPGLGQKDLLKLLVDPVLANTGSGIHKQGNLYVQPVFKAHL